MNFIELLNLQIYEKIVKFTFTNNIKVSIFAVISFDPLLLDRNIFDLFSMLSLIEEISGKSAVVKKIFFRKESTDIKFIVQSSNISKLYVINFLIYLSVYNALYFLQHLSLKLLCININKNLLIKLQNFTLISNFYGNLEKYVNNNVKCDLYAILYFNKTLFNYFYSPILINL